MNEEELFCSIGLVFAVLSIIRDTLGGNLSVVHATSMYFRRH